MAHVPKLHEKQVAAEVAVMVVDHIPAAHAVQDEDPDDAHDPELHAIHAAEDVAAMLPEAFPAAQLMHTDCELAGAVDDHVPGLHAVHNATLSHAPTGHVAKHTADPGADTVPPPQFIQVAIEVAPVTDENVPELHRLHAMDATEDHAPVPH